MATPTIYCPTCGTENDEYLERCTACDGLLDEDAAPTTPAPVRPFHVRAFGYMAAASVVLVLLSQVLDVTFSMSALPGSASISDSAGHLETLVDEGRLAEPYTYSDMTGRALYNVACPEG